MKSGFVTLIGRPNVGKSTLMNRLIGTKIAITSHKAQTTRKRIETVYTDERGQVIFLDTPGIHRAKTRLGDYMVEAARGTLKEVDLILWLVEPGDPFSEKEEQIAGYLAEVKTPRILVINKADTADEEKIALCRSRFESQMAFDAVYVLSALTVQGVEELMAGLFERLPEGPLYYDPDTLTDQTLRELAAELVREQALNALSEEVPHGIAVDIESFEEEEDITRIQAAIICEKETHKGIVIGKGGSMLKKIGSGARAEMMELLGTRVDLRLFVKVRKDWRNDSRQLGNFGYRKKK